MVALMALMTMGLNAQVFVLESGDIGKVFQNDKKATVKTDLSKAKIANLSSNELTDNLFMEYLKQKDPDVYNEWDKHEKECFEFFTERWNDVKGALRMDGDAQADYTLKIKFDYIDMGNVGAALWAMSRKAGGIMMRGTIELVDASGKSVCKVKVNDYQGQSVRGFDLKNPNFGRRMALFHKSLAREFLDFAKKKSK